ncbi:MAG: carboxypeptidase regulatory-like domain-containing protein [Bacteroidetes bacterium]|nr:carboxypeptidase regulatory-like domain-containing protein [Bacteroidota bacterium]
MNLEKPIKYLLVFFLLFSSSALLFAGETGKLSGKVTDKESGEPLIATNIIIVARWENGKEVPLAGESFGAASDLNGEYYIINIAPGKYSVKASYIGFQEQISTVVQIFVDKTTNLDFELTTSSFTSAEVVVSAFRADKVEVDLTATKQSYDISQIEQLPGISDVGDILGLQVDVSDGHFRGGRSGEALYLMGGASIVNPLNNSVAFEPMTMALEQVEVYTSGFSAEYGNVQSGIINMVTKEGQSTWQTRVEGSSTNSFYKTWGGSVFNENNLHFYSTLSDVDQWVDGVDPKSGKVLWAHFGIGFPENYLPPVPITWPLSFLTREDSVRTAELVRLMWLQGIKDVGLEYDKPDYRFEFSTGGPLTEKVRMFFATRQNFVQPFLPTTDPNIQRQIISNVVYRPDNNNKIKVVFNYNFDKTTVFGTNFYDWYEGTLNTTIESEESQQYGIQWNHVFDKSSFIDVKVNMFITERDEDLNLLGDNEYSAIYQDNSNWRFYTDPTGHTVGRMTTSADYSRSSTLNLSSTYSNQLDNNNYLKAGLQFNYYDMMVENRLSASNASSLRLEEYHAFPYEGAVFIQDKMEFEGLIANIGMRLDFYNFNTEYYTDKYSPYRNPAFSPTNSSVPLFDEGLAGKESTKLITVLQPRIGISFPVDDETVLHLNYGVFTQRPAFQFVFVDNVKLDASPNYVRLGNPELEPEKTIAYDIGVIRSLPFGFFLDVSAYLKDVSNLVQFSRYEDKYGNQYQTFDNREYADIKGFHVNLEKNEGAIRGYARYNWQSATGKSANAMGTTERAIFIEDSPENNILPDPEDIYLDYDRTHKGLVNLRIVTPEEGLLGLNDFAPFSNIVLSATYKFQSGRPFTWDASGKGLQFNQRTPDEHDLKIRISKKLFVNDTSIEIYLEGYNVLNHQVFSYSRTFSDDATNPYRQQYMENRENILTDLEFNPYTTSIENYLYTNTPRHFRFGVEIRF